MEDSRSSYRPHDPGHDYYAPGIYLITLVVRDRHAQRTLLGELNDDLKSPGMRYSDIGRAVMEEWHKIPAFESTKGRRVIVHNACCMPDHFHGVIEVREKMDRSVGQVIWGFKVACTKRWRETGGARSGAARQGADERQPSLVAQPDLHRMSKKQRAEYYAQHPEEHQPLWDDNYDDTICLSDPLTGEYSERHFAAMLKYVDDNARRSIVRRLRPQFMQRCLHLEMRVTANDGREVVRDYAAFGNLFLLRWAKKVQVFCHRDVNGVPSGTDYSMFHHLNTLAEEICRFDGEAVVIGGMKDG